MRKRFVGTAEVSGCGQRDVITLCVEADDKDRAEKQMERIALNRFPFCGNITDIHEATKDEAQALPLNTL